MTSPSKSLLGSISLKDIPAILPALSPSEQEAVNYKFTSSTHKIGNGVLSIPSLVLR